MLSGTSRLPSPSPHKASRMVNCKASELLIQALCVPFSQRCLRCPPSGAHHQRSVQVRVMPASALAVAAAGWRATKCAYGTVRGDGMAQRYSTPPSSPGAAHNCQRTVYPHKAASAPKIHMWCLLPLAHAALPMSRWASSTLLRTSSVARSRYDSSKSSDWAVAAAAAGAAEKSSSSNSSSSRHAIACSSA